VVHDVKHRLGIKDIATVVHAVKQRLGVKDTATVVQRNGST